MPTFATNPALEAAIVANADEDTPRLAYADWLDEHSDPDRAEFIRVQSRLADMSPAEPDWIDLRERQHELAARLTSRRDLGIGEDADGFDFDFDLTEDREPPFHRGFPHFVNCRLDEDDWDAVEIARVATEIARLVRTTTIRGVSFSDLPLAALNGLLAEPAVAELTGFACFPYTSGAAERDRFYRALGAAPAVRRMKHLLLYAVGDNRIPAAILTGAKEFGEVRRLTVHNVHGTKAEIQKLTHATWFRRLRHLQCYIDKPGVASQLVAGLGELPELHTLDLPAYGSGAVASLAAGKFPALARLDYCGPLGPEVAKKFAKSKFPSLVAFEAVRGMCKNDGLAELLKAPWFARLRALDLSDNGIGDQGAKALAAHPVAKQLRALKFGQNPFGKSGLMALAQEGAFPELGTLDLRSYLKRKATPAELATFLSSLQRPRLRHLDLHGWPLGDAGAKALAANPAFAGLTRLNLEACNIGDPGAKALFGSPHLQNLVELQLSNNPIRTGADALADPATLPRLGVCHLGYTKITQKAGKKLERDGLSLLAYSG